MKKLLFFVFTIISLAASAQFKNLQVNQKVHFQDDSITSCYVVIERASMMDCLTRDVIYQLCVFKSKSAYEKNKRWILDCAEIPASITLTLPNDMGSATFSRTISVELKKELIRLNPTWTAANINIEN